jgi:photosystem II stability/assembly factor-like uncharacterized protein
LIFISFFVAEKCNAQAWIKQESGLTSELRAVAFFDSLHGFAAGDSCIETTDGGKHWTLVPEVNNCNDILIDKQGTIWFASNTCDTFIFSLDHGKTFIKKQKQCMIHLASVGSKIFGTAPSMAIYSTSDSGNSWQRSAINGNSIIPTNGYLDLFNISFSSNSTGIAVGADCEWVGITPSEDKYEALLLTSFDTGKNWIVPGPAPDFPHFLTATQAIDSNSFIIAGDYSYIALATPLSFTHNQFASVNLSPLRSQSLKEDTIFEDIYFFNVGRGFVIGQFGTILYTKNSGNGWSKIPSPDSTTLLRIVFSDSSNGWIVGANGVILHTNNGGWIGGTSEVREVKNQVNENSLLYNIDNDSWILRTKNILDNPEVKIYSVLGLKVSEGLSCNKISQYEYEVPVNKIHLASGFYFAQFQTRNQNFMLPFFVK